MDLEAVQMMSGKRWSMTRLAVVLCFALTCALLIGSLISPSKNGSPGTLSASPFYSQPAKTT